MSHSRGVHRSIGRIVFLNKHHQDATRDWRCPRCHSRWASWFKTRKLCSKIHRTMLFRVSWISVAVRNTTLYPLFCISKKADAIRSKWTHDFVTLGNTDWYPLFYVFRNMGTIWVKMTPDFVRALNTDWYPLFGVFRNMDTIWVKTTPDSVQAANTDWYPFFWIS